jgi:hypothetical protein
MIFVPVLVLLGTVPAPSQVPTCGAAAPIRMGDSGIVALRLGLTVDQVRDRCKVVRDTTLPNWDLVEPERVLFVMLGADTVQAALDANGRVVRIYVDTPRIRTIGGLGVGTALHTLAKPGAVGAVSEATFGVSVPGHCGLRFVVTGIQGLEQGTELNARRLQAMPRGPTVTRVEIASCSR